MSECARCVLYCVLCVCVCVCVCVRAFTFCTCMCVCMYVLYYLYLTYILSLQQVYRIHSKTSITTTVSESC